MENTTTYNKRIIALLIVLLVISGMIGSIIGSKLYNSRIQVSNLTAENEKLQIPKVDPHEITEEKLQAVMVKMQPKLDPLIAKEIADVVIRRCKVVNMDPSLIIGLIYVESGFNPFAQSEKQAMGLMQIRYSVWKKEPELKGNGVHAEGALFWIDRNITSGTDILKKYYQEAGCDMRAALYRYNTGSTAFSKNSWNIEYVNKVIFYTYWIKTLLAEENRCITETIEIKEAPIKDKEI